MSAHAHDTFFKAVFARPELAADLIRRNLPPAAVAALDLDHLEHIDREFVDETLRSRRADLIFRAPLREARGREAWIPLVLIEHRSTPWRLAPLDMLGYGRPMWRRYVERYRAERGRTPKHLPLLLPIVVYQGRHPWSGPRDLVELFDLPPALAPILGPYLPRFRLLIDDLAVEDPARDTTLALSAMALVTMQFVRDESDPAGFKLRWRALLDASVGEPHMVPVIEASAQYLYDVSDRLSPADIIETAEAVTDPDTKEKLMTLGEKFKALGRAEGIQQGLARGEQVGQARVLLKQIRLKFGAPDDATRRRVEEADVEQLDRWSARILTAGSLAELLAEPD